MPLPEPTNVFSAFKAEPKPTTFFCISLPPSQLAGWRELAEASVLFRSSGSIFCLTSMERRVGGKQKAGWRTGFQRKYARHLAAVLRNGRIQLVTSGLTRSLAVKQAADLSLAMMAMGRTAWSRAILRKYLARNNKYRCQRRQVVKSGVKFPGSVSAKNSRPCKTSFPGQKSIKRAFRRACKSGTSIHSEKGTLASRMQILRQLIPGSCGLDTPVFLEEVADYIVALKMQVQGMQALTSRYTC